MKRAYLGGVGILGIAALAGAVVSVPVRPREGLPSYRASSAGSWPGEPKRYPGPRPVAKATTSQIPQESQRKKAPPLGTVGPSHRVVLSVKEGTAQVADLVCARLGGQVRLVGLGRG